MLQLHRKMRLTEVPSDILGLHQLRILDLSQNSLQSIPEVTFFGGDKKHD